MRQQKMSNCGWYGRAAGISNAGIDKDDFDFHARFCHVVGVPVLHNPCRNKYHLDFEIPSGCKR